MRDRSQGFVSCFRCNHDCKHNKNHRDAREAEGVLSDYQPILGPIRASEGCLSFNVYVDSCDENSSLLVSEWDTEADLNIHLRSSDFAILRGAMSVLGVRIDEYRALIYAGGRQISDRPPFSMISLSETLL